MVSHNTHILRQDSTQFRKIKAGNNTAVRYCGLLLAHPPKMQRMPPDVDLESSSWTSLAILNNVANKTILMVRFVNHKLLINFATSLFHFSSFSRITRTWQETLSSTEWIPRDNRSCILSVALVIGVFLLLHFLKKFSNFMKMSHLNGLFSTSSLVSFLCLSILVPPPASGLHRNTSVVRFRCCLFSAELQDPPSIFTAARRNTCAQCRFDSHACHRSNTKRTKHWNYQRA